MAPMSRIPPLPPDAWDDELRGILERRPAPAHVALGEHNIFATLARNKALFTAWMPFAGHLLARGALPPRERELLILRTAQNCGSDYEWGQHVRIGLAAGLSRTEIDRAAIGPSDEDWGERDQVLLRAADELHLDNKISDTTWAQLAAHYDERSLIEITILVGQYHLVAFALNSLEVELDEGLERLPGSRLTSGQAD
jgi:4-carboxymuconolactone decarboxylase